MSSSSEAPKKAPPKKVPLTIDPRLVYTAKETWKPPAKRQRIAEEKRT